MKTLLLIASLALAMPSVAAKQDSTKQDVPVIAQDIQGLIVTGTGSVSARADICHLTFSLFSYRGGFSPVGGTTQEEVMQKEAMLRQKNRQAITEALQPFGLQLDKDLKQPSFQVNGSANYASATLPLSDQGEVRLRKGTQEELLQALKKLEMGYSFNFSFSNKVQAEAMKPLLGQAVKNGIEEAKTLAALGGANTIRLTGMRVLDSRSFITMMINEPTEGVFQAPMQTVSRSVKLYFAPLEVIISTRK